MEAYCLDKFTPNDTKDEVDKAKLLEGVYGDVYQVLKNVGLSMNILSCNQKPNCIYIDSVAVVIISSKGYKGNYLNSG